MTVVECICVILSVILIGIFVLGAFTIKYDAQKLEKENEKLKEKLKEKRKKTNDK